MNEKEKMPNDEKEKILNRFLLTSEKDKNASCLNCRNCRACFGGPPKPKKFEDIFFNSKCLNNLRAVEKIEKCINCEWLYHCRGCRAIAYNISKDRYACDPQCWK